MLLPYEGVCYLLGTSQFGDQWNTGRGSQNITPVGIGAPLEALPISFERETLHEDPPKSASPSSIFVKTNKYRKVLNSPCTRSSTSSHLLMYYFFNWAGKSVRWTKFGVNTTKFPAWKTYREEQKVKTIKPK